MGLSKFQITLPDDKLARLETLADALGLDVGQVIEMAVRQYIDAHIFEEELAELITKAGGHED